MLKIDQVKQAGDLGATFIVAPGFNPEVVGYCIENGSRVIPGISNPTDIEMALEFVLEVVKFFPAETFGGLPTLKAISAPYGELRFMPTGGITETNLLSYLAFSKVVAWVVAGLRAKLVAAGDFAGITTLVKAAVRSHKPKIS